MKQDVKVTKTSHDNVKLSHKNAFNEDENDIKAQK